MPASRLTAQMPQMPHTLHGLWRDHWGIENGLHCIHDVTFGEDKCKVRSGSAPQNPAAFHNAIISPLRLEGRREIARTLRDFSNHPCKLLQFLDIMKN